MVAGASRVDEITTVLRTEILQGQYRPGERLPSERDLAARFESNRGAIREAVKKLEQLGIIEVTPGGVRILPVESATLEVLGYLVELGEMNRPEFISQMLDVLGAMTSLSIRSALMRARDEDFDEITAIVTNLVKSHGVDDESQQDNWMKLSEKLISVHQNLILRLVANGLRTQFLTKIETGFERDVIPMPGNQHLVELLQAVENRNADAAANAIVKHFEEMKQAIFSCASGQATPARPTEINQRRIEHA